MVRALTGAAAVLVALTVLTGAVVKSPGTLFGTRGSIAFLAADGPRVAIATTGIKKGCDRIVVWNAVASSFTTYQTSIDCPGGETSGGQSLDEVALAGTRVAWVESASGNLQDLTLRTAAPGSKTVDLAFAESQAGAEGGTDGDYLGNLHGSRSLLAYTTWSVCTVLPPGFQDDTARLCKPPNPRVTEETHLIDHPRLWTGQGGRSTQIWGQKGIAVQNGFAVWGVDAGRIAVQMANGTGVTILSPSGVVLRRIVPNSGPFAGAAFQGTQLVTLRNGKLEVYSTATGSLAKSIPLAKGARLRGVYGGLAVYVRGLEAHVVRLSDGKDVSYPAAGTGPVDAQMTAVGLFVSSNTPKSTSKGRVLFVPRAALVANP